MYLLCQKCCGSQTGDVLGAPCRTPGCDGVIEEQPEFRTLVDELPEPMLCGRRAEVGMNSASSPFKGSGEGLDRWLKFKSSHGNRVCSYCGSLHWEDMLALVKQSAEAPEDAEYQDVVAIEPSSKNYKVYVHQPGVRNAHEGGIKFYMQHVPRAEDGSIAATVEQSAEYAKAIKATRKRFDRYLKTLNLS